MGQVCISDTALLHAAANRAGWASACQTLLASVAISVISASFANAQTATAPAIQGSSTAVVGANNAPPPPAATDPVNDVIVTGTRQSGQKARNSATPIVIISGEALRQTGQVDLRAALEQLSPNISQPVYVPNGGGFKDNISVDGLNPDNVLVLVNGKRRHSSANITATGGPEQGSTGVDLDMIPVSAIDHIEILQSGDSAQYGSDAIAGVINIILKSASQGSSVDTTEGQYYAGDGFSRDVEGNLGTGLGQNGFLNISDEYSGHDHTDRKYYDSRDNLYDTRDPNAFSVNREDLAVNSGYYVNNNLEFYGFATYAHRTGSQFEDPRLASQLPEIYPHGFTPQQTIDETDFSVTGGAKGKDILGWHWDLSTTYGGDTDNIGMFESANLGLYALIGYTPTSFHLYQLTSNEWTNNLDITRPFSVPVLPFPVNVSLGVEDRHEFYSIGAGDPASYAVSGSQAAPGLSPASAGSHSRNVLGAYLDLATKLTEKWQVGAAGRFEHYTDVGNTSNGKIYTRYDFSPKIAIRGSFGTGFDAPSLAQEYLTTVTVGPSSASGLLAANSAAARSIGAVPLRPEQSTNYDFGIVLNPLSNLNVTADAYQIDIRDRIVTGGTASGATALAALSEAGFTVAPSLTGGEVTTSYFTNGANTRTRGIDVVGSYLTALPDDGAIKWDLAGNINDTEILKIAKNAAGKATLNAEQIAWLTTATPKFKVILGGNWQQNKWGVSLHENLFAATTDELTYFTGPNAYSTTKFARFVQGFKYTTDAAVHYLVTPQLQLTVGANNLFNVYPNKVPLANQYLGVGYDTTASQINIFGGFYYVNAKFLF
jgi:iron complex outermembrane receptor protein